jgi:hypothetical protein
LFVAGTPIDCKCGATAIKGLNIGFDMAGNNERHSRACVEK